MIPLILSIASSSVIFAIFKLFERFGINTFQAIVINYFTAFGIGFILYGNQWDGQFLQDNSWMPYSLLCAVMFITLFLIMGKSAQKNGVASTSVAVKMSMAISLLLMILLYSEQVTTLKIVGIILAFLGVYMITAKGKAPTVATPAPWMLGALFVGSGGLDFLLNFVQNYQLGQLSAALFSAISLGTAGTIGLVILLTQLIRKKTSFAWKNVVAGIILGIPNYFSIYLLLLSYKTTGWNDSTVLAITNVSVVFCSALIGFIAFKESASSRKIIGLISAILAIAVLYIANTN